MKKIMTVLLCLCLCFQSACAEMVSVSYAELIACLANAYMKPSEEALAQIDREVEEIDDTVARSVAEYWKEVWLDPEYRLFIYGEDDPAELPVTGRHAFVVLGYALQDGEMTNELIGRCRAAAAAARAFPDSILVCSGGATGENNPDGHTEAGLMKEYLTGECGIAPERIFTDERAMTTEDNARNSLAILQQQGIETMTVITSSYHQKRGQTLYNAMAAVYRQEQGYSVEIVGNYCWPVKKGPKTQDSEAAIAISQMGSILGVPKDQLDLIRRRFRP